MKTALLLALTAWLTLPNALDASEAELMEAEVAHLISFVAASGCDFNRNGDIHDSAAAADHLQLKYRNGKRWVDNAEEFIDRLASSSSISRKAYSVNCAGTEISASSWLHAELQRYRAEPTSAGVTQGAAASDTTH